MISTRSLLLSLIVFLCLNPFTYQAFCADKDSSLAFTSSGKEEYQFNTGILKGTLRKDGRSRGLSSLVHIPSGTRLDGGVGILDYYRIFTTNKRYGNAARDWPSTSQLQKDGSVKVHWPAGDDHPFELIAHYRLSGKATVDLETTVIAKKELPCFEVFMASYFNSNLPATSVHVKQNPEKENTPGFLMAKKESGVWQMFPRDKNAVKLIKDGRWKKGPNPVDWAIRPQFSKPLGIRQKRAGGLTAVLKAPPEDCFAISTPYAGEGHYSLYLSLFGKTLKAEEKATARATLVIQDPGKNQYKNLFNGKDLTGWHVDVPKMDKNPEVKSPFIARDGMLVSLGRPGGHLITDAVYKNFRLEIEYRFSATPGNCGVLVFASTPRALYRMFPKSIEVQMMHKNAGDFWCICEDIRVPDMKARRGPEKRWGVTEGKLRRIKNLTDDSENPPGKWNKMTIECLGNSIKVWVNGDLVNHGFNSTASEGQIAIQAEGSEVEFRKLQLCPLSSTDKK